MRQRFDVVSPYLAVSCVRAVCGKKLDKKKSQTGCIKLIAPICCRCVYLCVYVCAEEMAPQTRSTPPKRIGFQLYRWIQTLLFVTYTHLCPPPKPFWIHNAHSRCPIGPASRLDGFGRGVGCAFHKPTVISTRPQNRHQHNHHHHPLGPPPPPPTTQSPSTCTRDMLLSRWWL